MLWQSSQWLWLLCALAIPLLVHLLQRNASREITFAAVHWLRQKPQFTKHLLLREKWLLLLRMLLLALLVLMLAQPLLQRDGITSPDLLLVDPRIEHGQLETFLQENPGFASVLWLQPEPVPVTAPRPQAPDLWKTLSGLADAGEFRRAHILLRSAENPSGHGALRISPHWQWHALENANTENSAPLPRLALLDEGPPWLEAALRQLRETELPQLELQKLDTIDSVGATEQDWLIYDTAGALPAALREFIRDGGLLITDRRVQPADEMPFVEVADDGSLQSAALGRGSWLRYGRDWHSEDFFRHPDLPEKLWQQWFAQDWALQTRSRGLWSVTAPPGIAIPESKVGRSRLVPMEHWLLLAFVLLLALERTVALARPAAGSRDRD
ncbi:MULTISPECIES: BatA domain-containing protein [unclassified Microbulbifer]|uniref:BatA domain-containing protein n=1 Tax=unclassified Microbulbifer TaxID=2619833 RepID=UPI0027E45C8A|nr:MULTISPECIES: BatA domain-containing protein [unclassified Microbulbifer]